MWSVKVLGAAFAAMLAMSLQLASVASATNPCKPVNGVSRCVFGTQTTPEAEPEPLHIGQTIQQEWCAALTSMLGGTCFYVKKSSSAGPSRPLWGVRQSSRLRLRVSSAAAAAERAPA